MSEAKVAGWLLLYLGTLCLLLLHLVAWGIIWAGLPLAAVPLSWAWRAVWSVGYLMWLVWW